MNLIASEILTVPVSADYVLLLTAEERAKSRYWFETTTGEKVFLQLPRGTVLVQGNCLQAWAEDTSPQDPTLVKIITIQAQPEPVLTITAPDSRALLQAAYHLGNRHVPVEINPNYLRISPDSVLETMLRQRGLSITPEIQPFQPELGAYSRPGHHHEHHS